MTPERTKWINGHRIDEFYWAKQFIVYVDRKLVESTFEEAVKKLESEEDL